MRLAALGREFFGEGLDAVDAPGPQNRGGSVLAQVPGCGRAEAAACARDNDNLVFDILARDLYSSDSMADAYSSSVTFSNQSTALPSRAS